MDENKVQEISNSGEGTMILQKYDINKRFDCRTLASF